MGALLAISNFLDRTLRAYAWVGGWFFLALIVVICFDVLTRKFGFQLNIAGIDLGSTRLQELEWHLHAVLFCTWLGYAYVRNAHVRIDIAVSHLSPRSLAWLELFGCIVFALPYLYIAMPYAFSFALTSFLQNESSSTPNGLPSRWIIKTVLFLAFVTVAMAVLSVALRRIVFLFGGSDLARQAMPAANSH